MSRENSSRQKKIPISPSNPPHISPGPWIHKFASSDSDTFYSFFKHYYSLHSDTMRLPPGALIIHGFLLASFDRIIQTKSQPGPVNHKLFRTLMALKQEHTDYFNAIAPCFEHIVKAAALTTVVFNVEQCAASIDLCQQMLQLLPCIDEDFWLTVVTTMLKSENNCTTLKGLAFVHNIWPTDSQAFLEFCLHPNVTRKYFCHWLPLIRCTFQRILCYRVAPQSPRRTSMLLAYIHQKFQTYVDHCNKNGNTLLHCSPCQKLVITSRKPKRRLTLTIWILWIWAFTTH